MWRGSGDGPQGTTGGGGVHGNKMKRVSRDRTGIFVFLLSRKYSFEDGKCEEIKSASIVQPLNNLISASGEFFAESSF